MAECHPVGFQWVMEAKARGATVIHVDPRFTRTSAVADIHVPIRAGTRHRVSSAASSATSSRNERYFRDYVVNYTNAPTIMTEDFRDTEDLDGLFSGWDARATHQYDSAPGVQGVRGAPASGARGRLADGGGASRSAGGTRRGARLRGAATHRSRTPTRRSSIRAASSRCSSATSRATRRRWWSRSAASRAELFAGGELVTQLRPRAHHRRSVYAVGWTQHTVGVQYIRTAAIMQAAARQHGPARRRHHGAARPRLHPGLDRHPDALQPAARLPADAQGTGTDATSTKYMRERIDATSGWWANPDVRRHPAEGLVRRAATARERLVLRLPAAAHRRPLAHDTRMPPWPTAAARATS